jgi:hypothetical protein
MNKFLLALTILGTGAGGVLAIRQSAAQLRHEAQAAREAWLIQTRRVATAQSEQADLTGRIRELKKTLGASKPVSEDPLWSALQTNRADRLPAELRERLFEALGLNWQSSADYILVTKQSVRDIEMLTICRGKLTECAATVLAMTSEERGQVEAAIERIQLDFKGWVLANVRRGEPRDDLLADYFLPADPVMSQSISNAFAAAVITSLGPERATFILPSPSRSGLYHRTWRWGDLGWDLLNGADGSSLNESLPVTLRVTRSRDGDPPRLKARFKEGGDAWDLTRRNFPRPLQPLFPNGWEDLAKREGFELPQVPEKN